MRAHNTEMSITRDRFNLQCFEFIKICSEFGDTWRLQAKQNGSISDIHASPKDDDSVRLMLTKVELRKVDGLSEKVHSHEYNVVYSDSFEVPVMYFSISEQDGSPLGYERTLSSLIGFAADELGQVIHQVEHPILFRPFFMIHPCKTRHFMEPHKKLNPEYYLISWLSTVGSIMGLRLDSRYADLSTTESLDDTTLDYSLAP